jgi:conjugal transfer pilus assembly protein TrbC
VSVTEHPRLRVLAALVALAWSACALPGAWAQSIPRVTEEDLERARREQPTITDQDIQRARQKYRMPSEAELDAVPVPARPNIDALPQPAIKGAIDLEALAKGYASQSQAIDQAQGFAAGPGLFVFVSLSMPQATLQRLIDQAARAKAAIFLRGLAGGSLRDTVARVQGLIGQREVAFQIDPQAFDRFSIERVPSFVLVRDGTRPASCASGSCAPPGDFLRSTGDVSLDYALDHMARQAPQFTRDIAPFLRRIRG